MCSAMQGRQASMPAALRACGGIRLQRHVVNLVGPFLISTALHEEDQVLDGRAERSGPDYLDNARHRESRSHARAGRRSHGAHVVSDEYATLGCGPCEDRDVV